MTTHAYNTQIQCSVLKYPSLFNAHINVWGRYYHNLLFTNGKTEAQKGEVTCIVVERLPLSQMGLNKEYHT